MKIREGALEPVRAISNLALYVVNGLSTIAALPLIGIKIVAMAMIAGWSYKSQFANLRSTFSNFDVAGLDKVNRRLAGQITDTRFASFLMAVASLIYSNRSAVLKGEDNDPKWITTYHMAVRGQHGYHTPQKIIDLLPVVYEQVNQEILSRISESVPKLKSLGYSDLSNRLKSIVDKNIHDRETEILEKKRNGSPVTNNADWLAKNYKGLNVYVIADRLAEQANRKIPDFVFPQIGDVSISDPTQFGGMGNDTRVFRQKANVLVTDLKNAMPKKITREEVLQMIDTEIQKRENPQASISAQAEKPDDFWREKAKLSENQLGGWARGRGAKDEAA